MQVSHFFFYRNKTTVITAAVISQTSHITNMAKCSSDGIQKAFVTQLISQNCIASTLVKHNALTV